MNHISTTSILGVRVSAITYIDALREIGSWIVEGKRHYVCVAAVHLLMECQKNRTLLGGVNGAGLVTPDGMPLVWLLRLCGHKQAFRVYGPTLMIKLCALAAQRGWGAYLLGGAKGQSQEIVRVLLRQFPNLRIVGHYDTPVRPIPLLENQKIVAKINHTYPDLVFVGLGCPQQELWMIENREKLDAPVLIGVGAAFDFLSGRQRQAPEWMQHVGLEWLYRLIREPKRLWCRYTVINMMFLYLMVRELFRKKILLRP